MAWRYFDTHSYYDAVKYFKKSVSFNENDFNTNVMLGVALIEINGDLNEVLDYFVHGFNAVIMSKTASDLEKGEVALAVALVYTELKQYKNAIQYSPIGVKNTFGCSRGLMVDKLNWRPKMIALLDGHRVALGCP